MRNSNVILSKALAIILMVLAHTGFSAYADSYVNMFRMPLFFFMSGYCFKEKYVDDGLSFVKRKIIGIYWSYIKYSLVFLFLHNLFFKLNLYNGEYGFNGHVSSMYEWPDFFRRMFDIMVRMGSHEQLLGGYWFMKSLFYSSLICLFVIRFGRKRLIFTGDTNC